MYATQIPATRFSISPYTSENANPNRKLKTRYGNFLPDSLHSSFDNAFFHISPREARSIDPQMRVLMRVGLQAMEAAGLVVDEFKGEDEETANESEGVLRSEDVGCYVGVATNDYVFNLRNEVGVHYATGKSKSIKIVYLRSSKLIHLNMNMNMIQVRCLPSLRAALRMRSICLVRRWSSTPHAPRQLSLSTKQCAPFCLESARRRLLAA